MRNSWVFNLGPPELPTEPHTCQQSRVPLPMVLQNLSPISSECTIYKVPERLRGVKQSAYTPKIVSIGPYHHGRKGLETMEEHKARYLGDFLQRSAISLDFFTDVVKKNETKIRGCYAETIPFCSDEFVEIIVLDVAFIIELLLKCCDLSTVGESDRIFNRPWMIWHVWVDLLLLENQLPFFILEDIFEAHVQNVGTVSIRQLALRFFGQLTDRGPRYYKLKEEIDSHDFKLLHFVHLNSYIELNVRPCEYSIRFYRVDRLATPTITELHRAGVKFVVGSGQSLLDIRFKERILELPKFILSDDTDMQIRNVIAFEQCHFRESYVNDYIIFMNHLVRTPEDVELLVKYGILENKLDNSEAAFILLKNLVDWTSFSPDAFYFDRLSESLQDYYSSSWQKWKALWSAWKANLKQKYFKAAVVILVFTVIQTVCSIISLLPRSLLPWSLFGK